MPLFNNMTVVKDNEGSLSFMNKEAHEALTVPKTLYDALKKNSLPKDEIIEILGCDDDLDDEVILDWIRDGENCRTTEYCKEDDLNEKIKELEHECATRQADYDEKCKELEGLQDMEAQVTDALWDESVEEPRTDLIVADIHKLRKENEKLLAESNPYITELETEINELKEENEKLKYQPKEDVKELIHYKEMWKKECDELKETLERKNKQIDLLVKNKKNREKQLIHIRTICENTDEYIEEKVSEKMDEYVVKKQNDKIDKLKELLEEAEPYLSHYKGICSVSGECDEEEKLNYIIIEIENI